MSSSERQSVYATPLVRMLSKERGVNLVDLVGTGARGRIRRADVDAASGVTSHVGSRLFRNRHHEENATSWGWDLGIDLVRRIFQ